MTKMPVGHGWVHASSPSVSQAPAGLRRHRLLGAVEIPKPSGTPQAVWRMPEARHDREGPLVLEDLQKARIPELQWHIHLQGPGRAGALPAGAGELVQQPRVEHRASPTAQLPFRKGAQQSQADDRPSTALAASDVSRRRLAKAPYLQRSASCDIAWRVPQPPRPASGAVHPPQEAARLARMAPEAGSKAGSPANRAGALRSSQPDRAGPQAAYEKPGQGLQQRPRPSEEAVQASDPAALRRAKLQALKSRAVQKTSDAVKPSEPARQPPAVQPAGPQRQGSAQQSSSKSSPAAPHLQRKTLAAGQPVARRSSSASGTNTPKARVSYDLQDSASAEASGMISCQGCGRTFAPGPFEKHERICAKVFQSKRKPMDMKEQRISSELGAGGTFGAPPPLPPKGKKGVRAAAPSPAEPPAAARKAVPKWKAQSGQLRAAMAAARGDLPFDAPPVVDESLVPCPHCGRRFNAIAAERHIPKCQDIRAKPTRLLAKGRQGRR